MPHIQVEHFVFGVGPDDRQITSGKDVFESHGVIRWIECGEYSDVRVDPRIWLPDIPFVRRRFKVVGNSNRYRVRLIIDVDSRWKRRPAVDEKHSTPKKIDEPRPVRIPVVIGSSMKAQPCSPLFDVALKCSSLFSVRGRLVEPDNELIAF